MITVHSSSESRSKPDNRLVTFLGVGETGALSQGAATFSKVRVLQHLLLLEYASLHRCRCISFND